MNEKISILSNCFIIGNSLITLSDSRKGKLRLLLQVSANNILVIQIDGNRNAIYKIVHKLEEPSLIR